MKVKAEVKGEDGSANNSISKRALNRKLYIPPFLLEKN